MKLIIEIRPCSEMHDNEWYVVGQYRFMGVDFVGYHTFDEPFIVYCDVEVFSHE